jgi:hypothetical protein
MSGFTAILFVLCTSLALFGQMSLVESAPTSSPTASATSVGCINKDTCSPHAVIAAGTVTISAGAFAGSATLLSVTFPSSVKYIEASAFAYCDYLANITFSEGLLEIGSNSFTYAGYYNFNSYVNMSSLPSTLTTIGDSAFRGARIQSVVIPASVANWGSNVFAYSPLSSVVLSDGLARVGEYAFSATNLVNVTIPSSVTNISRGSFEYCSRLTDVSFPTALESIGAYAFSYTALTSVTLYSSISAVGTDAFCVSGSVLNVYLYGSIEQYETVYDSRSGSCSSQLSIQLLSSPSATLTVGPTAGPTEGSTVYPSSSSGCIDCYSCPSHAVIATGTVTISSYAFYYCPTLLSVTFPSSVKYIEASAFAYCDYLANITFSEGLLEIGSNSFTYAGYYNFNSYVNMSSLPSTLTTIGDSAFRGARIQSVVIPASVANWGSNVFAYSPLSSVVLSDGLARVGEYAFSATNLVNVTIPSSVTNISRGSFEYCSRLTDVSFPTALESIGAYAFSYTALTSVTLYSSISAVGTDAFCVSGSVLNVYLYGSIEQYETVYDSRSGSCSSQLSIQLLSSPSATLTVGPTAGPTEGSTVYPSSSGCINCYSCPSHAVIAAGTVNISSYAFYYCETLLSVTFPSSVKYIGERAFYSSPYLANITFSEGLLGIGAFSFAYAGYYDVNDYVKMSALPSTLTTIGDSAFESARIQSVVIPASLTNWGSEIFVGSPLSSVVLTVGLTRVGEYAFSFTNLVNVTIPSSVTIISDGAFDSCYLLNNITFFEGLLEIGFSAFSFVGSASTHKYVNISSLPSTLTTIGDGAFYGAYIQSVTIPASVVDFGISAFQYSQLSFVVLSEGLSSLGDSAFASTNLLSVTIPSSLTYVSQSAFMSCSRLAYVSFPIALESIGAFAFSYTALTSVTLYSSISAFGTDAFCVLGSTLNVYLYGSTEQYETLYTSRSSSCSSQLSISLIDTASAAPTLYPTSEPTGITDNSRCVDCSTCLSSAVIMDGITSIPSYAFHNCYGLESVVLSSSVTSIGAFAFAHTRQLYSFLVSSSNALTTIDEYAFYNSTVAYTDAFSILQSIGDYAFSSSGLYFAYIYPSLTTWGTNVFADSSLESLIMSEGVTVLGDYAFASTDIYYVLFPSTLTSVPRGAFQGCSGLSYSVTLPKAVISVGESAFDGTQLEVIYLYPTVVSVGSAAFCVSSGILAFEVNGSEYGSLTLLSEIETSTTSGCGRTLTLTFAFSSASPTQSPTRYNATCFAGEYLLQNETCATCTSMTYSGDVDAATCLDCSLASPLLTGAASCNDFVYDMLPQFSSFSFVTFGVAAVDGVIYFTSGSEGSIGTYLPSSKMFMPEFLEFGGLYTLAGLTASSSALYAWDTNNCVVVKYSFLTAETFQIAGHACGNKTEYNGLGASAQFAHNAAGVLAVGNGTDGRDYVYVPGYKQIRIVSPYKVYANGTISYHASTLCNTSEPYPTGIAVHPATGFVYFATYSGLYYVNDSVAELLVDGLYSQYGLIMSVVIDYSGFVFITTSEGAVMITPALDVLNFTSFASSGYLALDTVSSSASRTLYVSTGVVGAVSGLCNPGYYFNGSACDLVPAGYYNPTIGNVGYICSSSYVVGASQCADISPTTQPTTLPTIQPSYLPILSPTRLPTALPTSQSTGHPTGQPTGHPSGQPTGQPSTVPTSMPTITMVYTVSFSASQQLTNVDAFEFGSSAKAAFSAFIQSLSSDLSDVCAVNISGVYNAQPTMLPTRTPTIIPSVFPTVRPTVQPTMSPTVLLSISPITKPTFSPTCTPTITPSSIPTVSPSILVTTSPSPVPTSVPATVRTSSPTQKGGRRRLAAGDDLDDYNNIPSTDDAVPVTDDTVPSTDDTVPATDDAGYYGTGGGSGVDDGNDDDAIPLDIININYYTVTVYETTDCFAPLYSYTFPLNVCYDVNGVHNSFTYASVVFKEVSRPNYSSGPAFDVYVFYYSEKSCAGISDSGSQNIPVLTSQIGQCVDGKRASNSSTFVTPSVAGTVRR